MTLRFDPSGKPESFGSHFIVGLSGEVLGDVDKRILSTLKPGGVLLLKRNFAHGKPYKEWISQLKNLQKDAAQYAERERLLISLDHEGGKVHRVPPPITHFSAPKNYAHRAGEVAEAMAVELSSLGVNLSFSPCVDIHTNPSNPIIGERAFGCSVKEVITPAINFVKGMLQHGVLPCAKHFPGHGDTLSDSHLELPVVECTMESLEVRELLPFKAMVEESIPLIMTAHIIFPAIDDKAPATFSPKILGDVLRRQFNYEGVIVSDDLGMKAVERSFLEHQTIGHALNAGCDMFIVAGHPVLDVDQTIGYAESLAQCLRKKIITEGTLRRAFDRVSVLFTKKLKYFEARELDPSILAQNEELARSVT